MPLTGKPKTKLKPGDGLYAVRKMLSKAPDALKPWGIVNLETGDVNGRWHANEAQANKQLKAMYANMGSKALKHNESHMFFCFADATQIPSEGVVWIEAIEAKTYVTPKYGPVEITEAKLQNFVKNFHDGVRGQEVALGFEHGLDVAKGDKASGWIRDAKTENNKLLLGVEFTEPAKKEIGDKEWKYFSLEWEDEWLHPDGMTFEDVMMGGTLTNRPVAKGLMPINFSEIITDDLTLVSESKELEHSEPGSGSPPTPRTDEDGSDDAAIRGGWRRETPPIAVDPEDVVVLNNSNGNGNGKGGNKLPSFEIPEKEAQELLRVLDLPVDADGVKVVEKSKLMFGELHDLRISQEATEQEKQFAEKYPQYWEQHNKLMKRDRENSARAFSETVQKIRKTEGYGLKDTKQGLSTVALEKVQEVHKKFSEDKATLEDFEECIKAITNGGIVMFGELGSDKDDDSIPEIDSDSPGGVAAGRKLFSEVVSKVQREHEDWSYIQCVEEAGKKHPDLAEAYKVTLPA